MCETHDYRIDPLIHQAPPPPNGVLFIDRRCAVCDAPAEVIRDWDDVAYCRADAELLRVFEDPGGVTVSQSLYERWGFHVPGNAPYDPNPDPSSDQGVQP